MLIRKHQAQSVTKSYCIFESNKLRSEINSFNAVITPLNTKLEFLLYYLRLKGDNQINQAQAQSVFVPQSSASSTTISESQTSTVNFASVARA